MMFENSQKKLWKSILKLSPSLLKKAIQNGADVNLPNSEGKLPLIEFLKMAPLYENWFVQSQEMLDIFLSVPHLDILKKDALGCGVLSALIVKIDKDIRIKFSKNIKFKDGLNLKFSKRVGEVEYPTFSLDSNQSEEERFFQIQWSTDQSSFLFINVMAFENLMSKETDLDFEEVFLEKKNQNFFISSENKLKARAFSFVVLNRWDLILKMPNLDINAQNPFSGLTLLNLATHIPKLEFIEPLLEKGADPNIRSFEGKTAFESLPAGYSRDILVFYEKYKLEKSLSVPKSENNRFKRI